MDDQPLTNFNLSDCSPMLICELWEPTAAIAAIALWPVLHRYLWKSASTESLNNTLSSAAAAGILASQATMDRAMNCRPTTAFLIYMVQGDLASLQSNHKKSCQDMSNAMDIIIDYCDHFPGVAQELRKFCRELKKQLLQLEEVIINAMDSIFADTWDNLDQSTVDEMKGAFVELEETSQEHALLVTSMVKSVEDMHASLKKQNIGSSCFPFMRINVELLERATEEQIKGIMSNLNVLIWSSVE